MNDNELIQFIEEVAGESHLRVETDLGGGFVRLRRSEAERRQAAQDIKCVEDIVLEALRNAYDASAQNIYVAMHREGAVRSLVFIDDGVGIRRDMHRLVFEPRVTSKLDTAHIDKWGMHGRGMALYSISVNTEEASVVVSDEGLGASMRFVADTAKTPEKTDQSSFPTFEVQESGAYAMRGPKNILRTACEFALEYRSRCSLYVGSPTEIIATLFRHALDDMSVKERVLSHYDALPYLRRVGVAFDPERLAQEAELLGLGISERTARRIMDGDIKPVPTLVERMEKESFPQPTKSESSQKARPSRSLKISPEDREEFLSSVREAYATLAEAYYLDPSIEPTIRVSARSINISIPLESEDIH